jgi:hypothetical protein
MQAGRARFLGGQNLGFLNTAARPPSRRPNAHFTAPPPRSLPSLQPSKVDSDRLRDHDRTEMESAAKRKAGGAAGGDNDGRPAKRQKATVRAAGGGG